jgi:hypothetical protein
VPFSSAENTSPPGSSVVFAPIAAKPSAIIPPGTRSFRSLKSSIVRIGFFEWMMFGP